MKKPITLGNIIILSLGLYSIIAFFMYIYEYSFNKFWYENDPNSIYMFSAMFGFTLLTFGTFFGTLVYLIVKGIPRFIVKIWNYPVIK